MTDQLCREPGCGAIDSVLLVILAVNEVEFLTYPLLSSTSPA